MDDKTIIDNLGMARRPVSARPVRFCEDTYRPPVVRFFEVFSLGCTNRERWRVMRESRSNIDYMTRGKRL